MIELSSLRGLIREAIEKLPLDNIELRKFYEAFMFRRSVSTTLEASYEYELEALLNAFGSFSSYYKDGFSLEVVVPVVERSFVDRLVSVVEFVSDVRLVIFTDYFEKELETSVDEAVKAAFSAYFSRSRTGLGPDYW